MRSQIVSFHCVLTNQTGDLISSTFNQDVSTEPEGPTEVLQGLAAGLKDLQKGEKRRICIAAKEAYGLYDPELVVECPRDELKGGKKLKLGDEVEAHLDDGKHRLFRVVQLQGPQVTLDANHPLAGQDLIFDIDATDVREATLEEQGSPRLGPGNSWLH